MTKYSTSNSDSSLNPQDSNASCSLCGSTDGLKVGVVAGAKVLVCSSCQSDDSGDSESNKSTTTENKRLSKPPDNSESKDDEENVTRGYTITNPDSSWVEEDRPDYEDDSTPYLVNQYYDIVAEAMEDIGVDLDDVSEDTDIDKSALQAIVDGNATSFGVGRSSIEEVEKYLGVELRDEV